MAYTIDLNGKVALITGAVKGIGFATAKLLAEAGAQVVIDDIVDTEQAAPSLDEIASAGKRPLYLQKDISIEQDVKEMVKETLDRFSRIDILVNNAGVIADWDKSFGVHSKGLFYCSENVCEHMVPNGGGRIINISSTGVLTGGTGIPQYVATKASAFSLTRYFARTYAKHGILVNGVMPAVIYSEMMLNRYKDEEEMIAHYVPQMPIRRIGYPIDIAKVVLFLCSDLSSFICGEIIIADGGRMHVG